jgi:H+/Cl- antiporter ClcA
VPLLMVVASATLVARTIEPRSVYDARLSDAQVRERQRARDQAPEAVAPG